MFTATIDGDVEVDVPGSTPAEAWTWLRRHYPANKSVRLTHVAAIAAAKSERRAA